MRDVAGATGCPALLCLCNSCLLSRGNGESLSLPSCPFSLGQCLKMATGQNWAILSWVVRSDSTYNFCCQGWCITVPEANLSKRTLQHPRLHCGLHRAALWTASPCKHSADLQGIGLAGGQAVRTRNPRAGCGSRTGKVTTRRTPPVRMSSRQSQSLTSKSACVRSHPLQQLESSNAPQTLNYGCGEDS